MSEDRVLQMKTVSIDCNPFERLPEIAARLGVKPVAGGEARSLIARVDDEDYDIWEVVSALLDKMDSVTRDQP